MSRLLRIALTWLLALAVPAQGFAAVSMLNCGSGHHGAAATAPASAHQGHGRRSHDDAVATHAGHGHDEAAAVHVGADADDTGAAVAPGDPPATAAAAHGFHKGTTGSCSACASCCAATAPPSAAPAFEASPAPQVFPLAAPPGVAAFLTDGPERPPRSFLA